MVRAVSMVVLACALSVTAEAQPPGSNPDLSPRGVSATQVNGRWTTSRRGDDASYRNGKWIVVDYGRPLLRGRQSLFGKGAEYGKRLRGASLVWRAGANQTTRLKTEVPLVFDARTVPAGEYSVFVDLRENTWILILSTQEFQQRFDPEDKTATWGATNYTPRFDVLRMPMKLTKNAQSIDQFTIGFVNMKQQSGTLAMWWDTTMASVSFAVGK